MVSQPLINPCDHPHPVPASGLTKNEKLVWDTLVETHQPQKAYEILDKLKEKGVRAPMTVYRALDGLEEKGVIHKLDGINAFVLCNHEAVHAVQVFLICTQCNAVDEVPLEREIESDIRPLLQERQFLLRAARLEVKGLCGPCSQSMGSTG
ncbi:MAG: Fur family transcriptional regulator [Pseudomonadota bacterium]